MTQPGARVCSCRKPPEGMIGWDRGMVDPECPEHGHEALPRPRTDTLGGRTMEQVLADAQAIERGERPCVTHHICDCKQREFEEADARLGELERERNEAQGRLRAARKRGGKRVANRRRGAEARAEKAEAQLQKMRPVVEAMAEAPMTKWSVYWIDKARAALSGRETGRTLEEENRLREMLEADRGRLCDSLRDALDVIEESGGLMSHECGDEPTPDCRMCRRNAVLRKHGRS